MSRLTIAAKILSVVAERYGDKEFSVSDIAEMLPSFTRVQLGWSLTYLEDHYIVISRRVGFRSQKFYRKNGEANVHGMIRKCLNSYMRNGVNGESNEKT